LTLTFALPLPLALALALPLTFSLTFARRAAQSLHHLKGFCGLGHGELSGNRRRRDFGRLGNEPRAHRSLALARR
jgi:hypothetical protein